MDHWDFNHHRHAKLWRNFFFNFKFDHLGEYCIFVILIHLCWLLCSGLLGNSEEVWKGAEDNLQEQVQPWLWGKITTPTHSKISPQLPIVFVDSHFNRSVPEEVEAFNRETKLLWKTSLNRQEKKIFFTMRKLHLHCILDQETLCLSRGEMLASLSFTVIIHDHYVSLS